MSGLHGAQGVGEIHIPYNWTYADATARTGATGFVSGDVGKFARQLDNNSIWMLISTTPDWIDISSGSGNIFGSNFQQESSDGESSTTSSTFQQKLRLTTSELPSGVYRIGFYYEWQKSGLSDFLSRVQVNDTTNISEGFEEAVDAGSDQWFVRGGFGYYSGSGVLNIDLDYAASGGDTSYIRRARLEIWRIS